LCGNPAQKYPQPACFGKIVPKNHRDPIFLDKKRTTLFSTMSLDTCWRIFTLFAPLERGKNTLQFTYLTTRWRHSFEDKLMIKNLWECKGFSSRRLIKEFPTRIGKDARLMTFFENCEQLVRSKVQLEVVGHSRFELQITLLPLRNLFRTRKTSLRHICQPDKSPKSSEFREWW